MHQMCKQGLWGRIFKDTCVPSAVRKHPLGFAEVTAKMYLGT